MGGVTWFLLSPAPLSPTQQIDRAIGLLQQKKWNAAREAGKQIEALPERFPAFPGCAEYILGQVAFHAAEESVGPSRKPNYVTAASYLKEAGRRSIPAEHYQSWLLAYARTLYVLGDMNQTRPLLEELSRMPGVALPDVALMLVDIYLDPSEVSADRLQGALELNQKARALKQGSNEIQSQLDLQLADIYLSLGQPQQVKELLPEFAEKKVDAHSLVVLNARVALAEKRVDDAITLLTPLAENTRLTSTPARHAAYLLAVATRDRVRELERQSVPLGKPTADELWTRQELKQRAILLFRKVIDRFEKTTEATASNLALGELHASLGATERSLMAFGEALRSVTSPDDLRNRWLSTKEFRERVTAAWTTFVNEHKYAEGVALSEMMTPLFPRDIAYEMAAKTQRAWAESIEQEFNSSSATQREALQPALRERWSESGAAYARLAAARKSASDYGTELWIAAEHLMNAHRFEEALVQLDAFLANSPQQLEARGLVRRAGVLLNLDRLAEAEANLKDVIARFGTDPYSFTAQLVLGDCLLEQEQPEAAEKVWRTLLASEVLTAKAVEWRDAQFRLGYLLSETAAYKRRMADASLKDGNTAVALAERREAAARWTEAVQHFDEYLVRYPDGADHYEVRYRLARSLQQLATLQRLSIDSIETDDGRRRVEEKVKTLLERALAHFQKLRDLLLVNHQKDQLDVVQQELLKQTFFEVPHTLYELGQDTQAIAAYSVAANRYPQDVMVLPAFVQMASSFARMGKPLESQSMLQQARVLLGQKQIPDSAFNSLVSNLSREEWREWLDRASRIQTQ